MAKERVKVAVVQEQERLAMVAALADGEEMEAGAVVSEMAEEWTTMEKETAMATTVAAITEFEAAVAEAQAKLAAAPTAPRVLRGKGAVTGAPTRDDLPAIKAGAKDSVGVVMDRYIKALLEAGKGAEAGAVGNLYDRLVHGNWVSSPEHSELVGD